jgi:hypothetical protein
MVIPVRSTGRSPVRGAVFRAIFLGDAHAFDRDLG